MKFIVIFILFLVFSSCTGVNKSTFPGTYKETSWSPMSETYVFKKDNTFEHYYSDDTYGTFGRGTYKIHGRRTILYYDILHEDSLICIEKKKGVSDSLKLEMIIMNAGFASEVVIYEKEKKIYQL